MSNTLQWMAVILLGAIVGTLAVKLERKPEPIVTAPTAPAPKLPAPVEPPQPQFYNISNPIPTYLEYPQIVEQIKMWNKEAPGITEVGTYGKTAKGTDLYYIRIANLKSKPLGFSELTVKPALTVMITGCIHGNEPHAAATVMAYAGTLLSEYGKNQEVTDLIDSRDIYIVPVVSPDSHPHSRQIDGVDPNRDFPGPTRPNHKSTPSVSAIQSLFLKVRPQAVISGHTFGRVYLYPYGDKYEQCPNAADFQRIIGKMGQMSQYRVDRACNNYARPIIGTEVDWYYRNGAFAVVMEFGTHQQKPSHQEIKSEFQRTYSSILLFIKQAPLVVIKI